MQYNHFSIQLQGKISYLIDHFWQTNRLNWLHRKHTNLFSPLFSLFKQTITVFALKYLGTTIFPCWLTVASPLHFQQIELFRGIFKRLSSWPNLAFTEVTKCFWTQGILDNNLEGTWESHPVDLCHQAAPRLDTLFLMDAVYVACK